MYTLKIISIHLALLLLTACNSSSSDISDEVLYYPPEISELEGTIKIELQVSLPSEATIIDTPNIPFKDRLQNYLRFCFQKSLLFKAFWKQFSVSYFVTIPKVNAGSIGHALACGPSGLLIGSDLYFVRVEQKKWEVYFGRNDDNLNIDGGNIDDSGQSKATLVFDDSGNFIRQVPHVIKTTDIHYTDGTYKIEFDFYSNPVSNFDDSYSVEQINDNSC